MAEDVEAQTTDANLATGDAAKGTGGESDPVLSQGEIDSLLGGGDPSGNQSGLDFLINNSKLSHERLPMLEVVFDRFIKDLTTTLRNFTNTTVDISVEDMTSVRFGDYIEDVPLPALLSVFRAKEWESLSLLYIEPELVYTLVDTLLGGRGGKMQVEDRPFTSIERGLVRDLIDMTLSDFTQAFSTISPVTFEFDRMETTPRFASIVRPVDAAILVNVKLKMNERGGILQFCIPYASIEPVRDQIVQMFMGEKSGGDNIWSGHLRHEVWDADVSIKAVLGEVSLSLHDILRWKPGSQIMLRTKPQSIIKACVGDFNILSGKVGRRDGYVSLRVEKNLVREKLKEIQAVVDQEGVVNS